MKNTSITFSSHFENFIAEQIASGRYGSASEVVREGLRLLEEKQTQRDALLEALKRGEESGTSPYSAEDIRNRVEERLRRDGKL